MVSLVLAFRRHTLAAVAFVVLSPAFAAAQPLGSFYWQLAPFCNVVVLHISQHATPAGAAYSLTGFDDQCGVAERATVVGTAAFNLDNTIGIGLTIVTTPRGVPVHVTARVAAELLSGPWADSAGNSGTFALLPRPPAADLPAHTAAAIGVPRPTPHVGIATGSITASHLAAGAVGRGQIDTSQVQARIAAACDPGQTLRAINADGSVICDPVPPGPPGSATAWGRVDAVALTLVAKSANVAAVARHGQRLCVTFTAPISLERRRAAVVGLADGRESAVMNLTGDPSDQDCTPNGGLLVYPVYPPGVLPFTAGFIFVLP